MYTFEEINNQYMGPLVHMLPDPTHLCDTPLQKVSTTWAALYPLDAVQHEHASRTLLAPVEVLMQRPFFFSPENRHLMLCACIHRGHWQNLPKQYPLNIQLSKHYTVKSDVCIWNSKSALHGSVLLTVSTASTVKDRGFQRRVHM